MRRPRPSRRLSHSTACRQSFMSLAREQENGPTLGAVYRVAQSVARSACLRGLIRRVWGRAGFGPALIPFAPSAQPAALESIPLIGRSASNVSCGLLHPVTRRGGPLAGQEIGRGQSSGECQQLPEGAGFLVLVLFLLELAPSSGLAPPLLHPLPALDGLFAQLRQPALQPFPGPAARALHLLQTFSHALAQCSQALLEQLTGLGAGLRCRQQANSYSQQCRDEQRPGSPSSATLRTFRPAAGRVVAPALVCHHECLRSAAYPKLRELPNSNLVPEERIECQEERKILHYTSAGRKTHRDQSFKPPADNSYAWATQESLGHAAAA